MKFDHDVVLTEIASRRAVAETPSGCRCSAPTDSWFDRSVCPEPCGSMHDICTTCGQPVGGCVNNDAALDQRGNVIDLIEVTVTRHAPVTDEDEAWCDVCFREDAPFEDWIWPCDFYVHAARALGVDPLA